MSEFKQFIQYRALAFKFDRQNLDVSEQLLASGDAPLPLRNVCAKLSVELSDRIDQTVSVLGVSKRLFIERALIEAIEQAEAMLDEVGAWEGFEDNAGAEQ